MAGGVNYLPFFCPSRKEKTFIPVHSLQLNVPPPLGTVFCSYYNRGGDEYEKFLKKELKKIGKYSCFYYICTRYNKVVTYEL